MADWNNINAKRPPSTTIRESGKQAIEQQQKQAAKMTAHMNSTPTEGAKKGESADLSRSAQQPIQAGRDAPQTTQKARVDTQAEGAKHNQNPDAQQQFQKVRQDARSLNQLEGRKPADSGKTATNEAVIKKPQADGAQATHRSQPQAKADPQNASQRAVLQASREKASKQAELANRANVGEKANGNKKAAPQAQVDSKLNPQAKEAAPAAMQAATGAVAGQAKTEKPDRAPEDSGSERKSKSEKKGADSSRAGRVYTDGGDASRGLGALMSGMGGGSSNEDASGGEAGAGTAMAVVRQDSGELPELDPNLHVFSDATEGEVAVMSKAQLYSRRIEKPRPERIREIAERDRELDAKIMQGLAGLSSRIEGEGELKGLLKTAMQRQTNTYGVTRG
ncbi:MAG TPA: hypothetical protein PLZ86_04025 [bacterium]|nr:hypothetical protein [bacterium]